MILIIIKISYWILKGRGIVKQYSINTDAVNEPQAESTEEFNKYKNSRRVLLKLSWPQPVSDG